MDGVAFVGWVDGFVDWDLLDGWFDFVGWIR